MQEISQQQEALNEREKLNVLQEKPRSSIRTPVSRQAKAAEDNAARKRYREALEVYRAQNFTILMERLKLMSVFLELKAELDGLEETEKWLLLSMAIRNQSSLLGFMPGNGDSEE